jgi:hypothetical protein
MSAIGPKRHIPQRSDLVAIGGKAEVVEARSNRQNAQMDGSQLNARSIPFWSSRFESERKISNSFNLENNRGGNPSKSVAL